MIRVHQPPLYVASLPASGYDGQEVFLASGVSGQVRHYRWRAAASGWEEVGPAAPAPPTPEFKAGMIIEHGSISPPTGWLLCDGSSLATATYPALFAALGYTWGGSGASFSLPDLRGRTSFHPDSGTGRIAIGSGNLAGTGGSERHTLDASELPAHSHPVSSTIATNTTTTGAQNRVTAVGSGGGGSGNTGNNSGGGSSHQNMPPYLVVPKIIKT